jgi:hypothetical protein
MATAFTRTTKWAVPGARTSTVERIGGLPMFATVTFAVTFYIIIVSREGDGGLRLSAVENGLLPSRRSLESKEFVRGDEEADGSC